MENESLTPLKRLQELPELGDILKNPQQFMACVQLVGRAAHNLDLILTGFKGDESSQGDNLTVKRCVSELSRHMDEAMLWITSAERAEIEDFNTVVPIGTKTASELQAQETGEEHGEDNSR